MSDLESFEVLSICPSMASMQSTESNHFSIQPVSTEMILSINPDLMKESQSSKSDSQINTSVISIINGVDAVKAVSSKNNSLDTSSIGSGANAKVSGENSMAAEFIMGEVNSDVLKTSLYSQFPSLCSMAACAEDTAKLQNLMSEYLALKNALLKVNTTMKEFYEKTHEWKDDMKRVEADYKQQLEQCQIQIATLRNENLELNHKIENQLEQIKIFDAQRKKEQEEMVQSISEKNARLSNMQIQIQALEIQQLSSFEYIPKNDKDSKEQPDYVDRLEHQRVVKDVEDKLSVAVAENLDLKDVQKQYIDEINCLKVNLTAAEELIKQAHADINLLKAKDIEKSEIFTKYETERNQVREEITVLRHQVEIYCKDFEMERQARQSLAGEKDKLLQDLRTLQLKNQELIEQAQQQWESYAKRMESHKESPQTSIKADVATATTYVDNGQRPIRTLPNKSNEDQIKLCPICAKGFMNLGDLQTHVNNCLDRT